MRNAIIREKKLYPDDNGRMRPFNCIVAGTRSVFTLTSPSLLGLISTSIACPACWFVSPCLAWFAFAVVWSFLWPISVFFGYSFASTNLFLMMNLRYVLTFPSSCASLEHWLLEWQFDTWGLKKLAFLALCVCLILQYKAQHNVGHKWHGTQKRY